MAFGNKHRCTEIMCMLSSMLQCNLLPGFSYICKMHSVTEDMCTLLFHLDQRCWYIVPGCLLVRSPKSARPNLEPVCMGVGKNIGIQDVRIYQDKLSVSMCVLFCGTDNVSSTKYLLEIRRCGRIVGLVFVLQITPPCFYAKHGYWVRASLISVERATIFN